VRLPVWEGVSNTKFPLSLVIITLNEQDGIARAIESAQFCDDVVVLDSGSDDNTCHIARDLGARVFIEEWRGFEAQKQRAVELAKNDWILSLDGDEQVGAALREELTRLLERWASGADQSHFTVDGYKFPRLAFNLGRWIRHGGWYPDLQLRLFNRKRAKWVGGGLHEKISAEKVEILKGALLHYPFKNHTEQVATNNRYSGLGAEALFKKGERFGRAKLFLKPVSKFIETYIFKRGFLDGLPGFIIAVGASYSIFLKYVKLWEMQKLGGRARAD
jgi:glycosyltransferase involved in cell wall biosynthesis